MEIKKQLTDPSEDSETYQNRIRMTKTPHAQPSRFQKAARLCFQTHMMLRATDLLLTKLLCLSAATAICPAT